MKPVCLVMGAGAGIGGNVARRFAREGCHAVLCRRSDQEGLNKMVETINNDGGSATGFLLNAIEANSIEERVAAIETDIGPIEVVVYNLGAQIGDRALKDTSLKAFETGWRVSRRPCVRSWQHEVKERSWSLHQRRRCAATAASIRTRLRWPDDAYSVSRSTRNLRRRASTSRTS